MTIDQTLLDRLSAGARDSARLRMNLDLRDSPDEGSQRMLNALEPGTILPVHRHRNTSETLVVLRGSVRQNLYDDNGSLVESLVLRPGGTEMAVSIPAGQWHNTVSLESGTVIFEAKNGPYAPLDPSDILTTDAS